MAKGLLGDALDQVAELKGTVAELEVELEKVRTHAGLRFGLHTLCGSGFRACAGIGLQFCT